LARANGTRYFIAAGAATVPRRTAASASTAKTCTSANRRDTQLVDRPSRTPNSPSVSAWACTNSRTSHASSITERARWRSNRKASSNACASESASTVASTTSRWSSPRAATRA